MRINNKIKSLIDELTVTYLTPGIQPSDIVDAVFEDNYKSIVAENINGIVRMSVTYLDHDDEGATPVVMRYTYNQAKVLMSVEQKVGKRPFKTQWDREQAIDSLLNKISQHLAKLNSEVDVQQALDTIPSDLRGGIHKHLQLVA